MHETGRKTVGPENDISIQKPLIFSDALAANIRLLGDHANADLAWHRGGRKALGAKRARRYAHPP